MKRETLFYRQGGICHWCKMPMRLGGNPQSALAITVDHLSMRNGEPRQSVGAHRICNNRRQHNASVPQKTIARVLRAVRMSR